MAPQDMHLATADAIDRHLGIDDSYSITRTAENNYQPWYASLLSSITLLTSGEEVTYSYIDYGEPITDVRLVVFTTNLVLVAEVDPGADGVPIARMAGRRSLIGMKLSASERIDVGDRRSHDWPGMLNLVLTYSALLNPIEIVASGVNRYARHKPAPIVSLIEELSADLAGTTTTPEGRQHGAE